MTVRDLIRGSLRLIGVISSGETPSADEQADALSVINDMLEAWSNESLLVFDRPREEFSLIPGQQAYTIGTGGNFNTTRPQDLEGAIIKEPSSTPPFEIEIEILNLDQWMAIPVKSVTGTFPTKLYMDDAFPLSTINVWPVPSVVKTLVLYSWKQLTAFANADVVLSLPPAYARALRYQAAVELAPEYGREASQTVLGIAAEAKANIKRMNIKPEYLSVDEQLMVAGKPFNWRTGE